MRHTTVAIVTMMIALAGCLGGDAGDLLDATTAAGSKEDAGARTGEAPSAPKSAYKVNAADATDEEADAAVETTAYPLALRTNPAKDPVTLEFTGEFGPTDCGPLGSTPVANPWQMHDIGSPLEVSDVFRYQIELTFENTDQSWAEIHLYYALGGASATGEQEPTGEKRGEVVLAFEGQGYRVDPDAPAWAAASCWYGAVTSPIPYTITVTYTFAENAVPSGAPMQFTMPDNASRLIVTGVPFDESEGVVSHFRVFGPDDALICECALNSRSEASSVSLPVAGDYVVLVDHTSGGFVGLALDGPAAGGLLPLDVTWERQVVVAHEGPQPAEESVAIDLPTTPLNMGLWTNGRGDAPSAGAGHNVKITVENARGEVLRIQNAGFVVLKQSEYSYAWFGLPLPGEWDYHVDHHKFAPGTHEVTLEAEQCDCEVFLWYQTYARA